MILIPAALPGSGPRIWHFCFSRGGFAAYKRLPERFAFIRRLQPHCLVSFKEGALGGEDFTSPEHLHLGSETSWDTPERQARRSIRRDRWRRLYADRWEEFFKEKAVERPVTPEDTHASFTVDLKAGDTDLDTALIGNGKDGVACFVAVECAE